MSFNSISFQNRMHNNNCKHSVIVITAGLNSISTGFLLSFMKLLNNVYTGEIHLIDSKSSQISESFCNEQSGNKPNWKLVATFFRIQKYIMDQVRISLALIEYRKADAYIFFLSQSLIIPIVTLKLMRKKVILLSGASASKLAAFNNDRLLTFLELWEKIGYHLADYIIIYSYRLIEEWNLNNFENKIIIAHRQYIDVEKFYPQTPINEREDIVGYIGRLSQEKGIMDFIHAIPKVLREKPDAKFVIIGKGPLCKKVERYLMNNGIASNVELLGWISHESMPEYLNKLKLVVLPSYTEGLPNIMLEAMACGTPVLASPVGGVLDMIRDNKTGFIMKDNNPKCIAKKIISAIDHADLATIVLNAKSIIDNDFSFGQVLLKWKYVFKQLQLS